ncbi:MAG TPA: ABC transporter permease [Mycobacteriales bacterium]|nr:ABC transporter permease [Mycobacteriales bacterium]
MSDRIDLPLVVDLDADGPERPARVGKPPRRFDVLRTTLFGTGLGRWGTGIVAVVTLFCFVGPLIYKTEQVRTNINEILGHPNAHHLLGSDGNGYDELGRLMLGGQSALEIGFVAALLATVVGTVYGGIAGYFGGLVDGVMMRLIDTLLAVPSLLLLLVLFSIIRPNFDSLVLVLGLFAWLVPARLIRGESLTLRTREFVLAARLQGAGNIRIVLRHLLPNALGTIVVNTTFQIADAILTLAILGFLGFGVAPPATNWGTMLNDGVDYAAAGSWWLLYPAGILIVLTVVAFNFIGEGLEETLGART